MNIRLLGKLVISFGGLLLLGGCVSVRKGFDIDYIVNHPLTDQFSIDDLVETTTVSFEVASGEDSEFYFPLYTRFLTSSLIDTIIEERLAQYHSLSMGVSAVNQEVEQEIIMSVKHLLEERGSTLDAHSYNNIIIPIDSIIENSYDSYDKRYIYFPPKAKSKRIDSTWFYLFEMDSLFASNSIDSLQIAIRSDLASMEIPEYVSDGSGRGKIAIIIGSSQKHNSEPTGNPVNIIPLIERNPTRLKGGAKNAVSDGSAVGCFRQRIEYFSVRNDEYYLISHCFSEEARAISRYVDLCAKGSEPILLFHNNRFYIALSVTLRESEMKISQQIKQRAGFDCWYATGKSLTCG